MKDFFVFGPACTEKEAAHIQDWKPQLPPYARSLDKRHWSEVWISHLKQFRKPRAHPTLNHHAHPVLTDITESKQPPRQRCPVQDMSPPRINLQSLSPLQVTYTKCFFILSKYSLYVLRENSSAYPLWSKTILFFLKYSRFTMLLC